ncbi:SusC/RagA family TonB-linked outer membrane protein [Yeosuana aromativorans]|uniref:SusC/RagA family TonB-linked outer membrane protein n=2 Tax=Yeosuana aromativorans TaxID=288019 RepID=A0A8J3FEZ3_9FLAO|nr:SusC/RagA family TonB-linked outer membrane protein [Yeosuana aromativorans]
MLFATPIFSNALTSKVWFCSKTVKVTAFQQSEVHGSITDVNGIPLAGVSIMVKGTQKGTTSDFDGNYSLLADNNGVLVYSFISFKTREIPVYGSNEINVVLETDITTLDTVEINAGYYTVKEKERTGNISRITAKDIEKQPVSNPLAAMQGRIPGVYIQQQSGVPGGSFNIQVRGRNSIASGNEPLYIVNGVPINTEVITSNIGKSITGGGNPLSGIDLNDVESIEVLKDADATAIYGSRGANGVILITTKKGHVGMTRFDLDIQTGMGSVANKLELLNSQQYVMMREEAFANDGISPTTANARDLLLWDPNRYTDWQGELIGGTAYLTNLQGAVSGGSELTSFRIGGGLREETTVFPGNFNYQKASGHVNLNHYSEDKRFQVRFLGNYVSEVNGLPSQDLTSFIFLPPVTPKVFDDNGDLNWGPEGGTFENPYAYLLTNYVAKTKTFISNMLLSYVLLKGLEIKVGTGYTTADAQEVRTTPSDAINPAYLTFLKPESNFYDNHTKSWILEPQIDYKLNVGKHVFNALIGATFQQNTVEGQYTYATDFASDLLLEDVSSANTTRVSANYTDYKYQAVFGRLNYTYGDRYIVNLTGRRDGSSRFGPGNRFANFGAIGTAWIFSNEPFLKEGILSLGKLRASYGTTGNDQIGDYRYLDTYTATDYPYQGITGLHPTRLFNPVYGWETNKKLEAAIDLGFIKNRIQFSASWYRNRSSNQLVGYPLPSSTGFSSIQNNLAAKVENTGIELELNTINIDTDNFKWTISANISFPNNELLEYPDLENSSYAQIYEVGKSLGLERSFHFMDVNPQTGVYMFGDVDSDGAIGYPNDLQSLISLDPDFYGGIGNTFSYKGFQLVMFLQFVKQLGYDPLFSSGTAPGRTGNQPIEVLNRWQQVGDNTSIQQFTQSTASDAYTEYANSYYYGDNRFTDASFVRLKTVSLTYQVPKGILGNLSPEIYVQGQNLLTITSYKGLDPEYSGSLSLPPLRMVTAGLRLTF